jgi:hypothetical protein
MAKKGNTTLSDLNSFLKQKSTESEPEKPSSKDDFLKQKPISLIENANAEKEFLEETLEGKEASESVISDLIEKLSEKRGEHFRITLLKVIKNSIESRSEINATDLMLLNSALYYLHVEKLNASIVAKGL